MQPAIKVPVEVRQVHVPRPEAIALFERFARKHAAGLSPVGELLAAWFLCCLLVPWMLNMIVSGGSRLGLLILKISMEFLVCSLAALPFTALFRTNRRLFEHTIKLPEWNDILKVTDPMQKFTIKKDPYSKEKPAIAVLEDKLTELRIYFVHHIPINKHKDMIAFWAGAGYFVYVTAIFCFLDLHAFPRLLNTSITEVDGGILVLVLSATLRAFESVRLRAFYRMAFVAFARLSRTALQLEPGEE